MALSDEEKVQVLRKAIALYLDCKEEEVGNFVFGIDRQDANGNMMFSGGWSAIPHWNVLGMIDELRVMCERTRDSANPQDASAVAIPTSLNPDDLQRLLERS